MSRASWGSRIGFIFAVAGSAVGLANIWRFPYVVGAHGGSAFIIVYLISLLLIGFPVFIAEILMGQRAQPRHLPAAPLKSLEAQADGLRPAL